MQTRKRRGNLRWGIALLLGLGVVINYFDRTNIAVSATDLVHDYHLSQTQFGIIASGYLWTYTLMQIPIGALLDKVGVKWMVRLGTILWSIATFLTAIVSGFGLILVARLLLGVAEAPVFPGSSKATGYWFPLQERGLATSAFDAAAKFSNVIGVPFVAAIVTFYGWRAAFVVTGILSVIYAIIFWITYRDPSDAKHLSKEEYSYIKEGGAQQENVTPIPVGKSFVFLLTQPKIWGITLGFAAYGYSFYLFLTWLPSYLETALHMTVLKGGFYTAIPWAIATVTDIAIGGWLVDYLIKRGLDSTRVRKGLFTLGLLMGIAIIGTAFTTDPNVAIVWISIALGGLAFAAPIGWSIPALIAPKGTVGTVSSIINFFNNLAGIIAGFLAGYIYDTTHSFALNFLIAGAVLILGVIAYLLLLGKIEQIKAPFDDTIVEPEAGKVA